MAEDDRLVVGVDSSTQSTKAIAFDRTGAPVAEGRAPIPLSQPVPGHIEQDPEDWWRATCTALRGVTGAVDPARIDGIAISDQRETVALTDAAGRAIRPAMTWLDSRSLETLDRLVESFGGERLHAISGKPVDVTPVVYRLHWLRERDPTSLDAAARILDVHGFLTWRLAGVPAATWTSADPFGIFDVDEKAWSVPLLDHLGIPTAKLPTAHRPGTLVGRVTADGAAATGLRPGTPIYAAGGDGQCAGLGANAMRSGVVYLNLGTAVIAGLWSSEKKLSHYWRTMMSPTGEGFFLEAVQRGGAFLVNWVVDSFCGGRADPGVFDRLTAEADKLPIGSGGVVMCPYIVGCMDPHWDPGARATITGLGSEHGPVHLFRAALEAITLETARALTAMRGVGLDPRSLVVIGGGANSPTWMRMVADATGLPAIRSRTNEASALGAAISAAVGAGWYGGFGAAADAMTSEAETIAPDPTKRAAWDALSAVQGRIYEANRLPRSA